MSIIQKIIAFFLSVLAFFGINPGKNNTPEIPSGSDIAISTENDTVIIALKSNMTTGYSWDYAFTEGQNGDVIAYISDEYVPDAVKEGIVGSGGTAVFTFKAVKEGIEIIKFDYQRPWENSVPEKRIFVKVTVGEDLSVISATAGQEP